MLDLKPQNLHALCHKLWSYFRYYLHQNSASLTFVDFLPLAEEIKNLQIVCCFCCVFSHDLSFENGSMIFWTDDAIKLWHKHCNSFSILIGCLHCITV